MLFYLLHRFVLFVFSCGLKGFDGIVGPQGFPGLSGASGFRVSRACSPQMVIFKAAQALSKYSFILIIGSPGDFT